MFPLLFAILVSSHNPFDAAALTWSGTATLKIRTSADGVQWSEWITPAIDHDITERNATAITHLHLARFLEYEFDAPVTGVTVTFFPPGGLRAKTSATFLTRVDWGCPDGEASPLWTPQPTIVTHAVVHHTAGANDLTDYATEVRNIWYFHTYTNGWGDIGYNFLIDPNGVLYEGRAGGEGIIGAHFSCRNTNTVGVALLGTYSNVAPTDAALQTLERLLADLAKRNEIDPTALVYHPPSALLLPTILGHRDGNSSSQTCTRTECPGDVLYSMLPMIRTDVAAAISAPPPLRRRTVRP